MELINHFKTIIEDIIFILYWIFIYQSTNVYYFRIIIICFISFYAMLSISNFYLTFKVKLLKHKIVEDLNNLNFYKIGVEMSLDKQKYKSKKEHIRKCILRDIIFITFNVIFYKISDIAIIHGIIISFIVFYILLALSGYYMICAYYKESEKIEKYMEK